MRLAIFGDIHGNIDALTAAYDYASRQAVDKMYHLGDLGGYAPFVNEVEEFLQAHGIEGVQGNYDDAVAHNKEHCGCKYEDPVQAEMAALSFEWTKKRASDKAKEYMRNLPFMITLDAAGRRIAIFHATPTKNNLYWYRERKDDFFRDMASRIAADVLIFGHTHVPFRRDLDGRIFINAGSVGKPKDGDTRTCVTMVTVSEDSVETDFVRLPYDVERTAAAIVAGGLPPYFADRLRMAA